MPSATRTTCCPVFDPTPWDRQRVSLDGRHFVKDRVTSFLHVPLNYGAVMSRNLDAIEAAGALPASRLVLTDENSLWGADVYFEVTRALPGRPLVSLPGDYFCRVFEGPFSQVKQWIRAMQDELAAQGKAAAQLYFFYTTCPACAKKYGRNYVVLLARV